MAGPRRPEGEELRRRVEAYGDAWRAANGSTEPADRGRAEAAIARLYASTPTIFGSTPPPTVAWVPSPVAGILAYAFAGLSREPIRSRWIRGDVGTGVNREFRQLAEPFGFEPAWVLRTVQGVVARLPPAPGLDPRRPVHPFFAAARALGLGERALTWHLVRSGAQAAAVGTAGEVSRRLLGPSPVATTADAAPVLLGESWPAFASQFGETLARDLVAQAFGRMVHAMLGDTWRMREAVQAMQPGQFDDVTPLVAATRDVLGGSIWRPLEGRAEREVLVDARLELARSAGPWWALKDLAIVSERPLLVRRDDRSRLHCSDGPAIAWADGTELYAWHGVRVGPDVVLRPDTISVQAIDAETNAEVRRVLIERFGAERLIREGGATLMQEDEAGRLWQRAVHSTHWAAPREEPIVMVEVRNSTPEPDGSRNTYWLRVPPTTRTAREGVAWTFGMAAEAWRPERES